MIKITERGSYDNNPINTTISSTNIFWKHYKKKQGGHLWRDLAGMTHQKRVQILEKFTTNMMRMYFQNPKEYGFSLQGAKFYIRLLDWIKKNPDIPVIKEEKCN
jgi:hypothetical protein